MTSQEIRQLNGTLYKECLALALTLTHDPTTARDLVQEAYYKAFKRQDQFQSGTNLRSWIKTIVYNTFVSAYRTQRRQRELRTHVPRQNHWVTNDTAENPAPAQLESDSLLKIIGELKPIYRRPFLLHVQGMPYDQIARSFNLPLGTVKSRVFTARKQLRQRISEVYRTGGEAAA